MTVYEVDHTERAQLLARALVDVMREVSVTTGTGDYNDVVLYLALASEIYAGNLPTVTSLNEITNIPRTTIRRHLKQFLDLGYLERTLRSDGYVYSFSNLWLETVSVIGTSANSKKAFNRVVNKIATTLGKMACVK